MTLTDLKKFSGGTGTTGKTWYAEASDLFTVEQLIILAERVLWKSHAGHVKTAQVNMEKSKEKVVEASRIIKLPDHTALFKDVDRELAQVRATRFAVKITKCINKNPQVAVQKPVFIALANEYMPVEDSQWSKFHSSTRPTLPPWRPSDAKIRLPEPLEL